MRARRRRNYSHGIFWNLISAASAVEFGDRQISFPRLRYVTPYTRDDVRERHRAREEEIQVLRVQQHQGGFPPLESCSTEIVDLTYFGSAEARQRNRVGGGGGLSGPLFKNPGGRKVGRARVEHEAKPGAAGWRNGR